MATKARSVSWLVFVMLMLPVTLGCMCMGMGEMMERMSQSRQSSNGMCCGGMEHGGQDHRATTQPTEADAIGPTEPGGSHALHHSH